MWPWLKHTWHSWWFNERYFKRYSRGGLMALATTGAAYADQLAEAIHAPKIVASVKVAAIVCSFVGGAIATERTPPVRPA